MSNPINFYQTGSGRCPVETFLDNLTGKQAQKVTWVLKLIQERDQVPPKYWKKLQGTDEIWEAQINFGGNTFRVLGFYDEDGTIILTNGFMKKTRKTPKTEIKKAEQRKQSFVNS